MMRFKIVESHTPDQWYIYARKWWGWHIYAVRSGLDRACRYVSDYRIGNKPDRQGSNISVAASFVWRCLTGATMTPFPHPAHRTGHADLPHPALGQDITPSPTARRAQAGTGVRARSARRGARVDRSRLCGA